MAVFTARSLGAHNVKSDKIVIRVMLISSEGLLRRQTIFAVAADTRRRAPRATDAAPIDSFAASGVTYFVLLALFASH
jgi:hypothetical protein